MVFLVILTSTKGSEGGGGREFFQDIKCSSFSPPWHSLIGDGVMAQTGERDGDNSGYLGNGNWGSADQLPI